MNNLAPFEKADAESTQLVGGSRVNVCLSLVKSAGWIQLRSAPLKEVIGLASLMMWSVTIGRGTSSIMCKRV